MKLCPKCKSELKPKDIGPVEIDECESCKGIWFDKGELRRAKDTTDSDLNWIDFEIWKHKDRFRVTAKSLKCPKCSVKMAAIDYHDTDVEINYCAQCQGT